jgi:hypothetical protein
MVTDDLGLVLALVGSTGSTLVSYVLPGSIYFRLHPQRTRKRCAARALTRAWRTGATNCTGEAT